MTNRYASSVSFSDNPTCIDLFCGAGGLTLGFTQAGGLPVAAVDHDKDSVDTFRNMFPMTKEVFCGDIEQWSPKSIDDINIDIVIGGPPCQGFSLARGQRFVDDPRNHLYKEFVRMVEHFQPKWLVLENVPGITNIGGGIILKQIYEDFKAIGYDLDHKVINMADYGVPQARKRAILVGNRLGIEFKWPLATHLDSKKLVKVGNELSDLKAHLPVIDAIGDLPWPMGNYFSHRANSKMRGPRNRDVQTQPAFTLRTRGDEFAICEMPATSSFIPDYIPDESNFFYHAPTSAYQELMREAPPSWIDGYIPAPTKRKKRLLLKGTRRLALREQSRIHSFPDWFQFSGRPYSQGKQIGNAVPPLFAKQLFEAILSQTRLSKDVLSNSTKVVKKVSTRKVGKVTV